MPKSSGLGATKSQVDAMVITGSMGVVWMKEDS